MELKRISALLVSCLLVASLAAACSSSAKKAASVSAGAKAGSTTTAAATSNASAGSGSSGSGSSADLDKCASAGAAYAKALAGESAALTPGKTFDAKALESEFDAAASSVPSNLKSDYNTLKAAITQFANAMQGVDLSNPSSLTNPATAAKLQAAGQAFSSPDVKAASTALGNYFESQCK